MKKISKLTAILSLAMVFTAVSGATVLPKAIGGATEAKAEGYTYTTTSALKCRSSMGLNGTVVGTFAKGTKINGTFMSQYKDGYYWMKVSGYSNTGKYITGYVADEYLK